MPSNLVERWGKEVANVYRNWSKKRPEMFCDVSLGNGQCCYAVGEYIQVNYPACFHCSVVWGSIGTALSSGIGMYLSNRPCSKTHHRGPIFVFEGDGSLLWSSTVLHYLISRLSEYPIVLTVFINGRYGKEGQGSALGVHVPTYANAKMFSKPRDYAEFLGSRKDIINFTVCYCVIESGGHRPVSSSVNTRNI